jgi:hypothetical protein
MFAAAAAACCPPANVIIASNVLNTNGNVLCGNIISGDGTFTGNLYVAGQIVGNIIYSSINISGVANIATLQAGTVQAGIFFGNGSGLSGLNASNLSGSANLTSLNVSSLEFQNAILDTNLPIFNNAQGTWGSSANVSQVTVDQYGRVSNAANVAITSSQWTTINGNVAYQNGVSIGILSNPPPGSNLYVRGTANVTSLNVSDTLFVNGAFVSNATNTSFLFDTLTIPYLNTLNILAQGTSNMNTLNVATLFADTATVFGPQTLNVLGTSNLNIVYGRAYFGNGAGLSNLNASNLTFGIVNSNLILGNTLSNIQVSNISGYVSGNALGNLNASNLTFGVVNSTLIYGNTLSNIQFSNIVGLLPNTISNLNASNLAFGVVDSTLIYGNTLSNITGSNVTGNVPKATVALVVSQASQPNITSVGTLSSLSVSGTTSSGTFSGSGSGLTNVPGTSVTGTVQDAVVAQVVSQTSQPNITSVGTLTSLSVVGTVFAGTFSGSGASLVNIPASSIDGTVATAQSVVTSAQPNITSIGTLTGLAIQGLLTASNGSAISNINAANVSLGTLSTSVFPASGVTAGTYGSSANISRVTVDQYGRVTSASNVGFTATSQWTTVNGNVAYEYGVSIGTISNPPNGSNLYVLGTATFTNIAGNGSSIFSLNSSNLVGNVENATVAMVVSQPAQPNITSVGTLTSLNVSSTANVASLITPTVNVGTLNVISISNVNSLTLTSLQSTTANVGTLNVLSISNLNSLTLTSLQSTTANVGTLNVLSISNLNSLTTNLVASQANVGTLNVLSISNLNSLVLLNNLYAANSVTTTNLFANTLTMSNAASSITVSGNIYASNAIVTTNIVAAGFTSNASNTIFNYSTITIPFVQCTTLNAASTANVLTLSVPGSIGQTSLSVVGNVYASNAVTTTNVFATTANVGTLNVSSISNLNSLVLLNNLYAANALSTTNVFVSNGLDVGPGTLGSNVVIFSNASGGANTFVMDSNGRVSIGAASGAGGSRLSFGQTIENKIITLYDGNSGDNPTSATNFYGFGMIGNSVRYQVPTSTTDRHSFFGGSTEYARITGTGISILTGAAPSANLQVAGNAYISNALQTTNVFATTANVGTLNVATISNLNTLVLTNNLYAPNALSTTNVFASNGLDVGPGTLGTNVAIFSNSSGGSNVFVMDSNGRIGIGTTTPGNYLQSIYSNVTTSHMLLSTDSSALGPLIRLQNRDPGGTIRYSMLKGDQGSLQFITATATQRTAVYLSDSVQNYYVNDVERMRMTSVGISIAKIANPSATLDVLGNIFASNALSTTNVISSNINVSYTANVANLVVTSNILAGPSGNTYVAGNVVVSGNVYSSLGKLGEGGGYYLSLPTNIAVQPGYNGPIYGAAYPLSVGLSNGFTINGTSTLITITTNGNFRFSRAGPYILNAVFNSSDNITGLAVGSNVADIHGQDQGYLYRYTTFVSQNPTEVIEIPINVTDPTLYYYLDLFKVDAGTIYASTTGTGGTYLTITPLTGGGLATGGPGGTPGTQWISSASNIYFPNSVGIGAVNPAYNLDVSTGNTATQRLITSNISSLGLYGPTLNISSNVLIQSNLAVGGGSVPNESPPYALYVTGQGYFSNHVSYQNFAGYRNRLVNGTLRVAARANSITVANTSSFSVSNVWFMDRWRVDVGGLATSNVSMTVKQDVPIGTTNGFTQCANVYVTRALTGTTGNTWVCPMYQTIEASFIFDFRWGQSTAKPAVFSFYANTSVSGDYSVVFRSRQDNTYFANLVSTTAGTWQTHVIYLPPCYIGSWAQPSTDGYVDVLIGGVSYGTNSSNNRAVAVTSGWTASPGFAPVSCIGATKWPASTGLVLQITGPQLEEGTIATPFEVRPLTQTYIYCQRFYETNQQTQYASALGTGHVNSIPYVTTKRNNANVSVYRDSSNLTANTNISRFVAYYGDGTLKGTQAINSYLSSQYGFSFNFTNTGSKFMDASIMEAQFVWQADAEIY